MVMVEKRWAKGMNEKSETTNTWLEGVLNAQREKCAPL